MYRELFGSAGAEGVNTGVVLDVGPIPTRVAKPEGVGMGCLSGLEHKHQLVLVSIERTHPAIGLVPNADILQFGEYGVSCLQQFAEVTPIHAHKGDGAVPADISGIPQGLFQVPGKDFTRHLADAHGEFPVPDAPQSADVTLDRNVIRRIGKDEIAPLLPQHSFEGLSESRISAQ
jgi:hypothetical protein